MSKVIGYLKELRKKPYGKAVFFFGFYLIFFIVIFLILNLGGNDKTKEVQNTNKFNNDYFGKYNYSFEYKVVLDNNTYSYVGSKNDDTFEYTYSGKEYLNKNGISYNKEDESKEIENPIKFNTFFDESVISEVLNSSYIESKTTYDSGDSVYNLLISSNTLNKIIDDRDTDIEEIPNKIKLSINSNGFINEISYSLDSYCEINDSCNKLSIITSYKEFSIRS